LIRINLLPKTLRKRVEPGWWRLIAIAVPVVALAIITGLQLGANAERDRLVSDRDLKQQQQLQLQPYIQAQGRLTAQQKELEGITGIKAQLERERISWANAINQFVGRIPRRNNGAALISLLNMNLKRVDANANAAQTGRFDGKIVNTEIVVQGEAETSNDIEAFVRAYETSPNFGIELSNYTRNEDNQSGATKYPFSATVGLVDLNAKPPEPTPAPGTAPADGTAPANGTTPPANGTTPAPQGAR
jgi:type IV pilus assembly protein PilN